jgi:parallel beta-helix repeat protein
MSKFSKCLVFGTILLMVMGSGFILFGQCTYVENEDTNECFNTIQAAIDDADTDAGDTIKVQKGTFTEQITIDKSITLEGFDQWSTRIQYGSTPGIITVTADNVTIKKVGVFWTGSYDAYNYGINIESSGCLLDEISVLNCPRDIYVNGDSNTISNSYISTIGGYESIHIAGYYNVVCGNTITSSDDTSGYGIILFCSRYNEIIGNNISNQQYGIYSFNAKRNDIYYNNFINNDTHAYCFMSSSPYNQWDNGGTYGGNYWGSCTDNNCNGFCDTAYTIATGEVDNYPLAHMSTRKCQ